MTRTILVFGRTGSGKTTSIKYQGGPAHVNPGAESDTSTVHMYTLANGDRAIDMPGLHDTRGIDATDDTHSDESILRALLNFLAIQKIDTIHGINWHLQPATRVDGHIRREAKFIDGLVGRDGWRNVIVLIVENLRPRHEPPIRAAVETYTAYDALPVRGCVLDEETLSPKSISMYEDKPEENVVTLARLRISHSPIQICILDEECVVCHSAGDHRTYGRCHPSIAYKHASEVIHYNHSGRLLPHPHDPDDPDPWRNAAPFVGALFGPLGMAVGHIVATTGPGVQCKRGGCRTFRSSDVCYQNWEGCGCSLASGAMPPQRGGCYKQDNQEITCGGCHQRTDTSGCLAFCPRCQRLQADADFSQHGCANASVEHVLRRRV